MHWKEIRKSEHFDSCHKGTLAWSDVVRLICTTKNKRRKGTKLEIEDGKFYILCELIGDILYVINVKKND